MTETKDGGYRWKFAMVDQFIILTVTAQAIGWLPINDFSALGLKIIFWSTACYVAIRAVCAAIELADAMLKVRESRHD